MTNRRAKWIFIIGTLSSLILFLALTVDTHRQVPKLTNEDRLTEQVVAGKRTWQKYNCNDCHTILGFGGYYAPDMTKAYKRVGEAGIRERLQRPEVVLAQSKRKMPQQNLSAKEIDDVIAFFKWTSEIDTHDWPPQDSDKRRQAQVRATAAVPGEPGGALLHEKGCLTCHKVGIVGGTAAAPLEGVGAKYDKQTLAQYIMDPQKINPKSQMPAQPNVKPQEAMQMAEFLQGLK